MSTASEKLKNKISDSGLSTYKLSKASGVSESSIKNIIYGKSKSPRYEMMVQLAEHLNCKIYELLSDDDPRIQSLINQDKSSEEDDNNWNGDLHILALQTVLKLDHDNNKLSMENASKCANAIYEYAISNNETEIDLKFAKYIYSQYSG